MTTNLSVVAKLTMLPSILKAAELLHELELIDTKPSDIVKRYIQKNPDINEYLSAMERAQQYFI